MLILLCILSSSLHAQDSSVYKKLYALPDKFFNSINKRTKRIEEKLLKQTEKYLERLEKRERKLEHALSKKDSITAKRLFGDISNKYAQLQNNVSSGNVYSGRLDSVQTALQFLNNNKLPNQSSFSQQNLASVLSKYQSLQASLNQTEQIKKYVKERQLYLQQQLQQLGLAKELKQFQKDVYYYRAQIDEYKRALEYPSKLEAKLLQLANKIPAFKEFFRKNSLLAGMFRLPGSDPATAAAPIAGLQTRSAIQQDMLHRFGTGPDINRALQQNIQDAQTQINQLKQKVSQLGGSGSDIDMPNFKPNKQKVKSFWQRVELGANVQSTKSSSFFPATSDVALTAGYKLNNKSTAGIGVSYKIGWGENIRNIKVTHEGIGFRSFFDMQLKGSFYASGGFEYNYQQPFAAMQQLYNIDAWQRSGLVGVSKVVSVRSKLFKKTKVQLLWDFLSYEQAPRTQPIKFRVGYSF